MREKKGRRGPTIAEGEIHIHVLGFKEGNPSAAWGGPDRFLSSTEKGRFSALAPGPRKWEFLWSRLLLRHLAALYLDRDPVSVKFGRHQGGKPFLMGTGLQFSLSHTTGLIVCSFGYGRLGIDIERCRGGAASGARRELLARRFFSHNERRFVLSHPAGRRVSAFLDVFTLKEAYGKALGDGLATFGGRSKAMPLRARNRSRWSGWEYIKGCPVRPGYRLAHVAEVLGRKDRRYHWYSWSGRTLQSRLRSFKKGNFHIPWKRLVAAA